MELLYIFFLLLHITFAGFVLFLCLAFITGGPFVPSNRTSVAAMVDLAKLQPGQTVIDVGSGDGRVLFEAAKKGVHAIGIEINPYLVWFTRLKARFLPHAGTVTVRWQNLWRADLSKADVVFVYLIPWRMEELAQKLKRELKPRSLVVSNSFMFPHWKLIRKDAIHHVYAYRI